MEWLSPREGGLVEGPLEDDTRSRSIIACWKRGGEVSRCLRAARAAAAEGLPLPPPLAALPEGGSSRLWEAGSSSSREMEPVAWPSTNACMASQHADLRLLLPALLTMEAGGEDAALEGCPLVGFAATGAMVVSPAPGPRLKLLACFGCGSWSKSTTRARLRWWRIAPRASASAASPERVPPAVQEDMGWWGWKDEEAEEEAEGQAAGSPGGGSGPVDCAPAIAGCFPWARGNCWGWEVVKPLRAARCCMSAAARRCSCGLGSSSSRDSMVNVSRKQARTLMRQPFTQAMGFLSSRSSERSGSAASKATSPSWRTRLPRTSRRRSLGRASRPSSEAIAFHGSATFSREGHPASGRQSTRLLQPRFRVVSRVHASMFEMEVTWLRLRLSVQSSGSSLRLESMLETALLGQLRCCRRGQAGGEAAPEA
mmetsp:Transcript_16010/g.44666  ORF Transcript_16010/g.44666 Transcript_16010/m.44666 type:complete len:426 (-) Transcript_16010:320-1597(-)